MFEDTLVLYRRRRDVKRRLATVPLAVAFHGIMIGIFIGGQIFAIPPVPEPYLSVSFYVTPLPPLPVGRPLPDNRDKGGESKRPTPAPPDVQPTEIPSEKPTSNSSTDVSGLEFTGVIVDGGADPDMTEGLPQIKGDESNTQKKKDEVIHIVGDVVAPEIISRVVPTYPEIARKLHLQGRVTIEAIIDANGNVVDARIIQDLGMGCGEAAVEAIRTWKYKPATLGGKNVSVYLTVAVSFSLTNL